MEGKQISSLFFAVRAKVLCKYIGQLLLVFAALNLVPLVFALAVKEYGFIQPYAIIIGAMAVAGFLMQRAEASVNVQNNEVLVISALIFVIASIFGAIPFHLVGLSWMDAFFEAVSGITTTGLSTTVNAAGLPKTILFARAWLQWVGGLGIVVLSVAILLPQTRATLHLFKQNWEKEGIVASTRSYARIILKVYLVLSIGGFIALLILGVDWFDAVVHVLAAVSTGGFSTFDASLGGMQGRGAQAAVTFLSCLGAIPFVLYSLIPGHEWRDFFRNGEVRGLAVLSLVSVAAVATTLVLADGFAPMQGLMDGTMLALSAQTTTGFSTIAVDKLSEATKFILMPFMLIGGNVGSTAGGIKILRLLILLKMIKLMIIRSGVPADAVIQPRLMDRRLGQDEIDRCFLLILLYIIVVVASWLPFVLSGYHQIDALFDVVSATCTVGLSTGVCSPALPDMLKGILCIDMLAGRLEIVAFLVLIHPPTWFGKKRGD